MKGSAVAMAELSLRGSLEKQHGAESTQDLESGGLKRKDCLEMWLLLIEADGS